MILLEKTEVVGLEPAIRGMRNPMNSWDKSDSYPVCKNPEGCNKKNNIYLVNNFNVGPNDLGLMKQLAAGGPVHAKYRRMIVVYLDITAPLYWWKEFDTYTVGTVKNSCSTMHKIHAKEFTLDDFSHDHLISEFYDENIPAYLGIPEYDDHVQMWSPMCILQTTIAALNVNRKAFLETSDKKFWWQIIQLLPSSYNQKRTVMLNYEVLAGLYPMRKDHKLDEWHDFCRWVEGLPYSEIIISDTPKSSCRFA